MNIKILVCCHKKDIIPDKSPYLSIHVGKALHEDLDLGIIGDNTGDNISFKNQSYCELTGLYWAWKNLKDVDVIGICHYRRYFDLSSTKNDNKEPMFSVSDVPPAEPGIIMKILNKYNIILPGDSYLCDSLWDAYAIAHSRADMYEIEKAIIKLYPEYIESFNTVMHMNNKYSCCNMMICKKEMFDAYCEWLFKILEEAELHIDISNYDSYQARIYGFISERLLNVYVHYNNLSVCHRPIMSLIEGKTPSRMKQILHRLKADICFKLKY